MELLRVPSMPAFEVASACCSANDSRADASTCASTSSSRSTSPSTRQLTPPRTRPSTPPRSALPSINHQHQWQPGGAQPGRAQFGKWLSTQLEAGGSTRDMAVNELVCQSASIYALDGTLICVPLLVALAYESQQGSRVVQKSFEVASSLQLTALTEQLRGFIRPLTTSKHGNHVISKMFTTMRAASDATQFAALEVLNDPVHVVTNQFGCRVVQRIVETGCCPMLAEWIVQNAVALSQDEYGHFPVETLLECGEAWEKIAIIKALMSDENLIYSGKCCFVVKKILDLALLGQLLPQLLHQPQDVQVLSTWRHAYELTLQQASKRK